MAFAKSVGVVLMPALLVGAVLVEWKLADSPPLALLLGWLLCAMATLSLILWANFGLMGVSAGGMVVVSAVRS